MVIKRNKLLVNDQDYFPRKKNKYYRVKKRNVSHQQNQMTNVNKWTKGQNEKFLIFIKNYRESLICPNQRRQQKVFLQLSRFIGTRTSDQCRSHHQKMIKHHEDLNGIIEYLEAKFSKQPDSGDISQTFHKQEISLELNVEEIQKKPDDIAISPESFPCNRQTDNIWDLVSEDVWFDKCLDF